MSDMSTRITNLRSLLPDLETALKNFTSSSSKFRVVRTVSASRNGNSAKGSSAASRRLRTLYILDSSFNPPSRAHGWLAESALRSWKEEMRKKKKNGVEDGNDDGEMCRLLLLFSTSNADKAPSPASYAQRIALMVGFAEDLVRARGKAQTSKNAEAESNEDVDTAGIFDDVEIDIGLTTEPYYTDKSTAIASTTPLVYASQPRHVHLVGYDTLIRFCNPKYYPKYSPPLSALAPFFDAGHGLSVRLRPTEGVEADDVKEQMAYVDGLKNGDLEKEGFKREWGERIEVVEGGEGVGISSTRVRKAAKEQNWDEVERLCLPGVAAWVKDQGLYAEDE